MSLLDILGTGLAAGVVVQILQLVRDWWSAKHDKRARARQQAFELSNRLKVLSIKCEEIISHFQIEQTPPEQEGPDPPEIPKQDFLELTRGLPDLAVNDLARIADLEMQRIVEESYINFGWQTWMDINDVGRLQLKRLRFLADEASNLAQLVRRKHGLPDFGDHARLVRDA